MNRQLFDRDQIAKAVALHFGSNAAVVHEVRALPTSKGVVSGYYNRQNQAALVDAAARLSGNAGAVYMTLNGVLPDLLARSTNRVHVFAKHTTRDAEIVRRVRLLIDGDPKRPAGISATDAEHEAALARAREIRDWLTGEGWPEPIFNDSGNGGHLIYYIDLPNDAEADKLVRNVLKIIAAKFDDAAVTVDQSVHNAARIFKVPGTLAAKGDHTPERPHRIARMIDVPDRIEVVPREKLEQFTGVATAPVVFKCGSFDLLPPAFDIEGWLRKHGVGIRCEKMYANGGRLFELDRCPWRPDQQDGGAFVIQFADGGISAGCHHSKCADKRWSDLRDAYEPGWRENNATPERAGLQPIESAADPHKLARLFLDQRYRHPAGPTLKFWRGDWHRWERAAWRAVDEAEIKAELSKVIKAEFDRLSIAARQVGRDYLGCALERSNGRGNR